MNAVSILLLSVASANADPQNELLYFTGEYCIYCRQTNPIVSRLQRMNAPIRKVDVEREPSLVRKYGIQGIPAFVLVINGRERERVEGPTSQSTLQRMLAKIPRSAAQEKIASSSSQRPIEKSPGRSRSRESNVQLVSETPRKKNRFAIPFLGRNENREWEVIPSGKTNNSIPKDTVIRAKFGERKRVDRIPQGNSPIASSVRLRIKDREGISYGTGTVIDSRTGHTLVLTCGHIFRELGENSTIEVDVFEGGRSETYVGKVVRYNLDADVGLLSIPTESVIASSRVAGTSTEIARWDRVISIGCSRGENPTRQQLQVTALNRYRGPENIECTGVPVQGRSGGGLFNESGEVIGVCVAADPKDRRGLYAGLKAVQKLLYRTELAYLYQSDGEHSTKGGYNSQSRERILPVAQSINHDFQEPRVPGHATNLEWVVDRDQLAEMVNPGQTEGASFSKSDLQVNLGQSSDIPEFLKRGGEAEVICIIRPLDNPQAASRVVVIHRASAKFISYLQGELNNQPKPTMQTMKFPLREPDRFQQRPDIRSTSQRTTNVRTAHSTRTGPRRYRRSADLR